MAMETCVRGFSYMPESKLEVSLQYIEDEELERAWKVSRRQRARDQEQRIWEEFVKEQDIVKNAYAEDPYQFLHELPEGCLRELMETEIEKMRKESDSTVPEQLSQDEDGEPSHVQMVRSVAFSDDEKREENMEMFHIFDDDNDLNQSGGEEDQPESPDTVRERETENPSPVESEQRENAANIPPTTDASRVALPVKSTETVSSVIESSIYCARVKDIRLKISEEMTAIMSSLEVQNVMSMERTEVTRRCRRATEFSARFNRIYMYELQRQAHSVKRHVSQSLPLAQHTHFQAQMLRVVSLHQNILQALQVVHKSFPATSCLRECVRVLSSLCAFVRDVSMLCQQIPTPRDFPAANDLYNDELVLSCDKLEEASTAYELRVADFLSSSDMLTADLSGTPSSTRTKKLKKSTGTKTGTKSWSTKDTDARLSMYSLDTLRINLHANTSSRGNASNGAKLRGPYATGNKQQQTEKGQDKTAKRSSRRPLMRAPQSGALRSRHTRDMEITTMVEAVNTCESSQVVSRSASPRDRGKSREYTPRQNAPRQHTPRQNTPRQNSTRAYNTPRNQSPLRASPRARPAAPRHSSPKGKSRHNTSPRSLPHKKSTTSITSDTVTNATIKTPITPVTKIQCAKRTTENASTGRSENINRSDKEARSKNAEKLNTDRPKHTDRSRNTDRSCCTEKTDRSRNGKVSDRSPRDTRRSRRDTGDRTDITDMCSNKVAEDDGGDKVFCGVKELTDNNDDYAKCYAKEVEEEKTERNRTGSLSSRCDVTWLLRQLCSGDPTSLSKEQYTGAKNAQLHCIRGGSPPRQPSTPQLLRILEETIQKQAPKPMYEPQKPVNTERFRLNFNIGEVVANRMFQYRTKFVQHMLTSPLYANSAVGKPWEMIGGVSDKIIDEVLTCVAKEMQIKPVLQELYKSETH